MPAKIQTNKRSDIETKLGRFIDAQASVFDGHRFLYEWARESLSGTNDQTSYEVAKRIFKDVAAFAEQFDSFEVEFWNYLADINNAREVVDHIVTKNGYSDHKEYFFAKIEVCITTLNEVITEIKASSIDWPFLEDLENSLEELFDISEELIEIDIKNLRVGELADLIQTIPPQRPAPIEVIATKYNFKRKIPIRFQSRISDSSITDAASALEEVLIDTLDELRLSNCDKRVLKAFERCVKEISKEITTFSPIQFGVYVGVAESFKDAVSEEFGTFLSRQFIAALLQCEIFLRNFDTWQQYIERSEEIPVEDSSEMLETFYRIAEDPIFDQDILEVINNLKVDKRELGNSNKLDYGIFQGIANIVSEVCRQGLRHVSSIPRQAVTLIGETTKDGFKFTVGVLALSWLATHSAILSALSEKYTLLSWLKPIVEFVLKLSAQ